MTVAIRAITDAEVPAFRSATMATFGDDDDSDPTGAERMRALLPLAQCWAAFDGETVVATAATVDHVVVVPGGGTLPMAGLTSVVVRPTHRRRGLLRQLIGIHLEDARQRGVAISGLWSSDASIYGRFGYGLAAESDHLEIADARTVGLGAPRELDATEWADEPRARAVLPAIYARAIASRPGALMRSEVWWRERRFLEAPYMRAGASLRRHVLARRGDELVGYLAFRQRTSWTDGVAAGKIEIIELIGVDAQAEATLWRFALQIDLFPNVSWDNAPIDDVLAWTVADGRQVKRRRVDGLWIRVDDIATALTARTYAADGELRFSVEGAGFALVVEGGRAASCTPSSEKTEITMSRAALGTLYLGGVPASRLARANVIAGSPAALARADRLFSSTIAPWCPELF